jgi:hypothetical protein
MLATHVVEHGTDETVTQDDPIDRSEQDLRRDVSLGGKAVELSTVVGIEPNPKPTAAATDTPWRAMADPMLLIQHSPLLS